MPTSLPCLLRVVGSRSDFYALLFGIWCVSRRSKKTRNGLELCVEKLVTIEKLLDDGWENGLTKFNPEECKEKARTLISLPLSLLVVSY